MKPTDTLTTTIFSHNLWANQRLLQACAGLSDEQMAATLLGTYGSLQDTLQHFVRSEEYYLHRIRTGQSLPRRENQPPMTIDEMLESVGKSGTGLIEWASKVQADDVVLLNWKDDTQRQVPKAIILNQAINHATEHRAQVMAILTQLGIEPPDVSSWSYFEALDA